MNLAVHGLEGKIAEAITCSDNRHRKPAELGRLIERVMILDAVLTDRAALWLGAEHDKRAYFQRRVGGRLNVAAFPRLVFGDGPTTTVRYFPDKLPIGIRLHEDPVVFIYLVTQPLPFDFRLFLCRHAELLRALPEWTIRLLAPGSLRKAAVSEEARWRSFTGGHGRTRHDSPARDRRTPIGGCYTGGVHDRLPPLEPDPVIEAYKKDVDRTLLQERLKRTPTERVEDLAALAAFADELAFAGRRRARP